MLTVEAGEVCQTSGMQLEGLSSSVPMAVDISCGASVLHLHSHTGLRWVPVHFCTLIKGGVKWEKELVSVNTNAHEKSPVISAGDLQ